MNAYIGLGSNVGDRLANLRSAREHLAEEGLEIVAASSVYETEPQDGAGGDPDFLNACLKIETDFEPEGLLRAAKRVERALGRQGGAPRHAPRPIDVDLLLVGDRVYRSDRLTLPHPQVAARRFVLAPLLELDPELALPDGTRLAEALERIEGQRATPVGPL